LLSSLRPFTWRSVVVSRGELLEFGVSPMRLSDPTAAKVDELLNAKLLSCRCCFKLCHWRGSHAMQRSVSSLASGVSAGPHNLGAELISALGAGICGVYVTVN
jgi:hypothetical protein